MSDPLATSPQSGRSAPDLNALAPLLGTVRDVLRAAVSAFGAADLQYGQGTANAYDDAVALVYWALHLPVDAPDALLDARLSPQEVGNCLSLIRERTISRRPVAYLTGEAWLRGLRFRADERALVPRSLLVEVLQESLMQWRSYIDPDQAEHDPDWPARILDLCTGGGSIAIHAAHRFPRATVLALDINEDALALCAENIALHRLGERISLRRSDLLGAVSDDRFDLILCNPPYVPDSSMDQLPPEFRAEPVLALAGGSDGMDLVRRLLADARRCLDPHGVLLIEIGHEQAAFEAAFPTLSFAWLPVSAGEQMVAAIAAQDLPPASASAQ